MMGQADFIATPSTTTPVVMYFLGATSSFRAKADGSALVIHANPDDYSTWPIGGAGERIACAIIP